MLYNVVIFLLVVNISSFANAIDLKSDTNERDLLETIENIKRSVEMNKSKFEPSVMKAQTEAANYQGYASTLLETGNVQPKIAKEIQPTIVDNKDSNIGKIDKWLNSYKQIQSSTPKAGFYIFVSFSMPKTQLQKLDNIARKIGARLVIRGLKDNSFKSTLSYIKEIQKQGIALGIDPKRFEQFGVNVVPAFVLSDGLKYDKIVGNISIPYVLEKFKEEGETALAQEYLKRLGNDA